MGRETACPQRTVPIQEAYLFPVPSQFMHAPRAIERCGKEWSLHAYTRALIEDALAMTGCIDAAIHERTENDHDACL